jgi:hypothetical protein
MASEKMMSAYSVDRARLLRNSRTCGKTADGHHGIAYLVGHGQGQIAQTFDHVVLHPGFLPEHPGYTFPSAVELGDVLEDAHHADHLAGFLHT